MFALLPLRRRCGVSPLRAVRSGVCFTFRSRRSQADLPPSKDDIAATARAQLLCQQLQPRASCSSSPPRKRGCHTSTSRPPSALQRRCRRVRRRHPPSSPAPLAFTSSAASKTSRPCGVAPAVSLRCFCSRLVFGLFIPAARFDKTKAARLCGSSNPKRENEEGTLPCHRSRVTRAAVCAVPPALRCVAGVLGAVFDDQKDKQKQTLGKRFSQYRRKVRYIY